VTRERDSTRRAVEFERIRDALHAAGLPSEDFGRHTTDRYPHTIRPAVFDDRAAVPILLAVLPTLSHPDAREALVSHLATPHSRPSAAPPLIRLFRDSSILGESSLKWTIGNALSFATTKQHADELLELALDSRHGRGRQMIVDRLGRISGNPRVIDALKKLSTDPEVSLHALAGLRWRLETAEALEIIHSLLTHPSEGVRRGAEYNMRKLRRKLKKLSERSE